MNYLIVFNNTTGYQVKDIHSFITTLTGVIDWWHYLPDAYILNTTFLLGSKAIADQIRVKFPNLLFLVIAINLRDYNGVLNKGAWEWISKKNTTPLQVKPINPPLKVGPTSSPNDNLKRAIELLDQLTKGNK